LAAPKSPSKKIKNTAPCDTFPGVPPSPLCPPCDTPLRRGKISFFFFFGPKVPGGATKCPGQGVPPPNIFFFNRSAPPQGRKFPFPPTTPRRHSSAPFSPWLIRPSFLFFHSPRPVQPIPSPSHARKKARPKLSPGLAQNPFGSAGMAPRAPQEKSARHDPRGLAPLAVSRRFGAPRQRAVRKIGAPRTFAPARPAQHRRLLIGQPSSTGEQRTRMNANPQNPGVSPVPVSHWAKISRIAPRRMTRGIAAEKNHFFGCGLSPAAPSKRGHKSNPGPPVSKRKGDSVCFPNPWVPEMKPTPPPPGVFFLCRPVGREALAPQSEFPPEPPSPAPSALNPKKNGDGQPFPGGETWKAPPSSPSWCPVPSGNGGGPRGKLLSGPFRATWCPPPPLFRTTPSPSSLERIPPPQDLAYG